MLLRLYRELAVTTQERVFAMKAAFSKAASCRTLLLCPHETHGPYGRADSGHRNEKAMSLVKGGRQRPHTQCKPSIRFVLA